MNNETPNLLIAVAVLFLFSGVQAQEHEGNASCAKPGLSIDFESEDQMRLLERDFVAFEACVIDYVTALHAEVSALNEAIASVTKNESLTAADEDEVIEFLSESLQTMESYRASVERATKDLEGVVQAILENVPAGVFNQWDAQTKVAEP